MAIGDLHGDFEAYRAILRSARLVDERGRWAGGETVLVQLGDIADRGPDSLKIIRHLMRLQREAKQARGKVVVVLGNHEAMMMTGDLRYVHPGEYAAFADSQSERRRERAFEANRAAIENSYRERDPTLSAAAVKETWFAETPLGMLEHQAAWHPTGEIGRWAARNPAVALIGETIFVHGGISPAYTAVPIEEINRRVAAALAARETAPDSIINDPAGPLWYR
ncbi:MAG TPA: metallophosphoesterase, partial [Chloroflexota bacterium]|nr:metallophosphoesterase [Chloroflexota bacterium]